MSPVAPARVRACAAVAALLAALALLTVAAPAGGQQLEAELERAVAQRETLDAQLAAVTARIGELDAKTATLRDESARLTREVTRLEAEVVAAKDSLAQRLRFLYAGAGGDEFFGVIGGRSLDELKDRTRYLMALSRHDAQLLQDVTAARRRLAVREGELAAAATKLRAASAEAAAARSELDRRLAEAARLEQRLRDEVARREEEARRLAAEAEAKRQAALAAARAEQEARAAEEEQARRRALEAAAQAAAAKRQADAAAEAARKAAQVVKPAPQQPKQEQPKPEQPRPEQPAPQPPKPAPKPTPEPKTEAPKPAPRPEPATSRSAPEGRSGATACPQARPRSYSDTWGAPRSGGRRHQGTDIFGVMGGEVYAIADGVVEFTRVGGNAGLWLGLRGDDGHDYWYMHLQDFVAKPGQRVSAGALIAHNGDTGNARGRTPHIHFEYHPNGGGPVNPYPLVRRVCG